MAAKETINNPQTQVESIVNRWLVDYYVSLAIEFFKNEQYSDFCAIRDVLHNVLARPLESTDTMPTKIAILLFLSRINDGDRLDLSFEADRSLTPLESALLMLQKLNQECTIAQPDFENTCTLLKEMIVGLLIKNEEFDKAKEVLNKHFPKSMVGKKAIFVALINKKSKTHDIIEQIDFHQFRMEMLGFCQRLCPIPVPFLHKAAKQLIEKRLAEPDDVAEPEKQSEAEPFSCKQVTSVLPVTCKQMIIQWTRLEAAHKALAAGSSERTFTELDKEVRADVPLGLLPSDQLANQESGQDGPFKRDSQSPLEASPADESPQTDVVPPTQAETHSNLVPRSRLYTVAQLVVEPDSHGSSQCTTASQELDTELTEEPVQLPPVSQKNVPSSPLTQSEVSKPTRKRPRQTAKTGSRASTAFTESSQEDEPPSSPADSEIHEQNTKCYRKSIRSSESSFVSDEESIESSPHKKRARDRPGKDPGDVIDICDSDTSSLSPMKSVARKSSTPHKGMGQDSGPSFSKWKVLLNTARETKETWSDEESLCGVKMSSGSHNDSNNSYSGSRKKMWTETETQKLKEGVRRFGEGNWNKIKSYYKFHDRTNVNLKDRWRTMKKLKMV